jgi:uncharacterized protein (TIGR03663 family)
MIGGQPPTLDACPPGAERRGLTRGARWTLLLAMLAVVAVALLLRAPGLGVKPLHSDEGVNGWFSLRLYWWNVYRYQPSDYHGPFLYYVNLVAFWLLGPTDFALRAGTMVFGAAIPLLLLPARRQLGSAGLVIGGLLIATGPCLVYFSRTVIHEVYLVFFTTLWAVSLARFAARPAMKWGLLAALGAFGCFANKETAAITAGALACGAGLAWLAGRRREDRGLDPDLFGGRTRTEALRHWFGGAWRIWLAGLLLFSVLVVLFFSSFFTNWPGVPDFFQAFSPWVEYGTTGRNQGKDWAWFWGVMQRTEGWAIWPALVAMVWAIGSRHRLGLALTGWAVSSFVVYSLIPYKTPWCVLQIDLPVFLLCAWLAGQGWLRVRDRDLCWWLRGPGAVAVVASAVAIPQLFGFAWEDNHERYDDDAIPYVYVQTLRGFTAMMQDHLGVAASDPDDDGLGPRVVNVEAKNPARWYTITRGWDHERSRYIADVPKESHLRGASIVVATGRHKRSVGQQLKELGSWHEESYPLRPGWGVTAWYRQDAWHAYQAAGGREAFEWPISETERVHEPSKPKRYWNRRDKRRARE